MATRSSLEFSVKCYWGQKSA